MKHLSLFFFLIFYFWSIGQSQFQIDETTYLLDDSLVFERFDMEPLNGILLDHSSREIGLYVNGKREGVHSVRDEHDSYTHVRQNINIVCYTDEYQKFFSNGNLMK